MNWHNRFGIIFVVICVAQPGMAQVNLLRGAQKPAGAQPRTNQGKASPPAKPATRVELTTEVVDARAKQAQDSNLADPIKQKVADLYRQAKSHLEAAQGHRAKEAEFTKLAANAETRATDAKNAAARFRAELDSLSRRGATDFVPTQLTEQQLRQQVSAKTPQSILGLRRQLAVLNHERTQFQQELAKVRMSVETLKATATKLESERATRPKRRAETRQLLLTSSPRLADLEKQLASIPANQEPQLTLAMQTELQARRLELTAEAPRLRAELSSYDAEDASDTVRVEVDQATQHVALSEKKIEFLDQALRSKRDEVEALAVRIARAEAALAHPRLRSVATRNADLAEEARRLSPNADRVSADLDLARKTLEALRKKYEQTRQKVESVGLSHSIGALLRAQRNELPQVRRLKHNIADRRRTIDENQLTYFKYDEELTSWNKDLPQLLKEFVGDPNRALSDNERKLKESADYVFERRKMVLASLRSAYSAHFEALVELSAVEQQTARLSKEFANFIDERVLWIRSSRWLTASMKLERSDGWFLDGSKWLQVGDKVLRDVQTNWLIYAGALALFAVLMTSGYRLRTQITRLGQLASDPECDQVQPTLKTILYTAIVALPWPLLFAFLAWILQSGVNGVLFARSLGEGCAALAIGLLPLELLRQCCRKNGLAEKHFQWPTTSLLVLRRQIRLFIAIGLPLMFALTTLYASDADHRTDFVERCLFILMLLIVARLTYQLLSPKSGVFHAYLESHPDGWLDKMKYLWLAIGVSLPLTFAGLTFVGYYYTARQLSWRLLISIWVIVVLIIVRAVALRCLALYRLQMIRRGLLEESLAEPDAVQNAADERDDRSAELTRSAATGTDSGSPAGGSELEQSDVSSETSTDETDQQNVPRTEEEAHRPVDRLTSSILFAVGLVGLWIVWIDVLPALRLLERWPLWTTTATVMETETAKSDKEAGSQQTVARQVVRKITVANLALAILLLSLTVIAARDVPGLLSFVILDRLPMDSSVRYALTTLVGYLLVFLGIFFSFRVLGWRWQQIQWLATALTFGLAFGLQEMFANFVAGVILLFERPIRMGDVVTIDNISGRVSKIRIRATTITDWDRKDFVVPNKEFITGRVLNWTLSDKVNRLMISVGVAYGSDIELARSVILQVAMDHPKILDEPPPSATLESFADSSLVISLRAFLPELDGRLAVIHELHAGIERALREAGITIPFPQRDVHVHPAADQPADVLENGG